MEILIFAKKRKNSEGAYFTTYITTLSRKDGTKQTMAVKFKDEVQPPKPANCPCYISFNASESNVSTTTYKRRDTGEEDKSYTLWVSEWQKVDKEFKDTSLDEFITE